MTGREVLKREKEAWKEEEEEEEKEGERETNQIITCKAILVPYRNDHTGATIAEKEVVRVPLRMPRLPARVCRLDLVVAVQHDIRIAEAVCVHGRQILSRNHAQSDLRLGRSFPVSYTHLTLPTILLV